MRHTVIALVFCCIGLAIMAKTTLAQTMIRVTLSNSSQQSVYVIAYDPFCRIRVFEQVLIDKGSQVVRLCAGQNGVGSLIVYDVRGRKLSFSGLRNGSRVRIRFR